MEKLNLTPPQAVPMYLGDDTTDEDAFRALKDQGITIRIGTEDSDTPTQAQYILPDPHAVDHFLQSLLQQLPNPS